MFFFDPGNCLLNFFLPKDSFHVSKEGTRSTGEIVFLVWSRLPHESGTVPYGRTALIYAIHWSHFLNRAFKGRCKNSCINGILGLAFCAIHYPSWWKSVAWNHTHPLVDSFSAFVSSLLSVRSGSNNCKKRPIIWHHRTVVHSPNVCSCQMTFRWSRLEKLSTLRNFKRYFETCTYSIHTRLKIWYNRTV